MGPYARYNSRNIFEYFTRTRAMFLCIDALDFKDAKGAPAPRMKIRCCVHDDALAEGARITDEVSVYIPISRFLLLAHNVLSGVYARRRQSAAGERDTVYFEHYGGNRGEKVTSTKLTLVNGMGAEAGFAFLATSGPGRITSKGGIVPAGRGDGQESGGAAQITSIFINLPDEKLKEFCLIGRAYAEQFVALDLQGRLLEVRRQRQAHAGKGANP